MQGPPSRWPFVCTGYSVVKDPRAGQPRRAPRRADPFLDVRTVRDLCRLAPLRRSRLASHNVAPFRPPLNRRLPPTVALALGLHLRHDPMGRAQTRQEPAATVSVVVVRP
jgi:hypothetical protein